MRGKIADKKKSRTSWGKKRKNNEQVLFHLMKQFTYDLHNYFCFSSKGQTLGRNPGKSLHSLPPFYSKSPLQLCLEIFISSNSRNLLTSSRFRECVNVNCKGERRKI
jgi:hypothetical protein